MNEFRLGFHWSLQQASLNVSTWIWNDLFSRSICSNGTNWKVFVAYFYHQQIFWYSSIYELYKITQCKSKKRYMVSGIVWFKVYAPLLSINSQNIIRNPTLRCRIISRDIVDNFTKHHWTNVHSIEVLSHAHHVFSSRKFEQMEFSLVSTKWHGPLARYVKLSDANAPGMPGTFSPPPTSKKIMVSDPGMQNDTCVTHVPWCMSGLLIRGGGENVPGIPGACATLNVTYLARGPLYLHHWG